MTEGVIEIKRTLKKPETLRIAHSKIIESASKTIQAIDDMIEQGEGFTGGLLAGTPLRHFRRETQDYKGLATTHGIMVKKEGLYFATHGLEGFYLDQVNEVLQTEEDVDKACERYRESPKQEVIIE